MAGGKINNFLVPNVSKLKGQKKVDLRDHLKKGQGPGEFDKLLKGQVDDKKSIKELNEIHLSSHAVKRMKERNLEMDSSEYFKLKNAINTLKNKGGRDSLVITDKAAYIIDVDNNKIVTAIDKAKMSENVFTKIDSTLFVE